MRRDAIHPAYGSGFGKLSGDSVPRCIDKDDLLAFKLDKERRLRCANGLLWVTVQGDAKDYLLGDAEEMDIPDRKSVVLEAEETSCFQID